MANTTAIPTAAAQIKEVYLPWPGIKLKCQVDKPNHECRPAGREGKRPHYNADSKNVFGHVKAETYE